MSEDLRDVGAGGNPKETGERHHDPKFEADVLQGDLAAVGPVTTLAARSRKGKVGPPPHERPSAVANAGEGDSAEDK